MSARIRLPRFADERGQSLVLALLVLFFLAISLGTVIFYTAGNQRNSNVHKAQQTAASLAEAGVNNAISVLANPSNANSLETSWSLGTAVLPDNSVSHPAYSTRYVGTTPTSGCVSTLPCVKWWGNLDTASEVWTLHAQATVPNPTGAAAIVKTMSAQVQVHPPNPKNLKLGVWNTIYSPFGPSSGCDTTVAIAAELGVATQVADEGKGRFVHACLHGFDPTGPPGGPARVARGEGGRIAVPGGCERGGAGVHMRVRAVRYPTGTPRRGRDSPRKPLDRFVQRSGNHERK